MTAPSSYQPGDVLEQRYRLVERLGRGGFGDVWRADELLPDGAPLRQVALKLLHSSAAAIPDWSEEARIIASLRHPALVTIYAAGLLALPEPRPYVAMELLIGSTLAEWVGRGERVAWRRVLSWARQAAAALDEIHRAGVVHLDLKPANLFLVAGGDLKVLDFGIARQGRGRSASIPPAAASSGTGPMAAGGDEEIEGDELSTAEFVVARCQATERAPGGTSTGTRSVVGTPGFMAPEVLEEAEASRAADAYALAGCIVQLATGRLPQQVGDRPAPEESKARLQSWFAEVQAATVRGKIRNLREDRADLPRALVDLLERWLALDPMARGLEERTLRAQLDEVWTCPEGFAGNPYRGLAPYGIEHEGHLFGRDDDIARIRRDLAHQPCVVLHGADGIGLRSLVMAGVIPAVAKHFVDDRDDWRPCVIDLERQDPDGALQRALERRLLPASADAPAGGEDGATADEVEGRGPTAEQLAERLRRWGQESRRGLVVVLDGLERLLQAPPERRQTLLRWLGIVGDPTLWPGVRCLAILREEHTPELLRIEGLSAALRPWLRFMGPPPATIAAEIVSKPATASGLEVGDVGVVEAELQRELRGEGVRLPLASLALRAWWARCAPAGVLTGDAWSAQQGLLGAVSAHADAVLGGMTDAERDQAEAILLRLVASDGRAVEVERADLLRAAGGDPERSVKVLDTLLAERLLVRRLDLVGLSHPDLARRWPRLHELRLHDMERLAFLEELRESAARWGETGRSRALLWRGDRLRELARRSDALVADLTAPELQFIAASRRAATRRKGLIVAQALGILLVLGVAYWVSDALEQRARRQQVARERAEQREAIGRMVSESRRRADPYARVALLAGAMRLGSSDPLLPLELFSSARPLPHARFLTLREVGRPEFPWDGRWLVGGGRGAIATVFDFEPLKDTPWGPLAHRLRPHPQGMDDLVPLAFDTSFVTRGLDGRLKVWRLGLSGEIALAAVSPMSCRGGLNAVLAAERAPVVACVTSQGIARWDLREVAEVQTDGFQGRLLDLSPDGSWVAAARLARVLFWQPDTGRRHDLELDSPPTLARFSPRDAVVALVRPVGGDDVQGPLSLVMPQALELYELGGVSPERLLVRQTIAEPAAARWDAGGLDLAVCNVAGQARWHYLRRGGRAEADPEPRSRERPCERSSPERPKPLRHVNDYGELLAGGRRLGPRQYVGGWELADGRLLTRDLVLFDRNHPGARGLLEFVGRDTAGQPELAGRDDSAVWVARLGEDRVLWQVAKEIRQYDLAGRRLSSRQGQVLGRCQDDRVLAWRKKDDRTWELFTARHGAHVLDLPRIPAFFLGADTTCSTVFLQHVDGRLLALDLTNRRQNGPPLRPVKPPAGQAAVEGYVYQVRPSSGRSDGGGAVPPGLWLAFSSGAMARLEGQQGVLRSYGHATIRPTAMGDGPRPGELVFADRTGVTIRDRGNTRQRPVFDAVGDERWEDLHLLPGGRALLLASAHQVAVLDLERREILGNLETRMRGRIAPWDDAGSVLIWSYGFVGPAVGEVLPIGLGLSQQVAGATSNLSAHLSPALQVELRAD